jgi:hypothetical protein
MPDASRHCKRLALELARWLNDDLRGPMTSSEAEDRRLEPSVAAKRWRTAHAKLKPGN